MTSKLKGQLATVAVFAFFAIIYSATIYKGIAPGASAHAVATALGLESGVTQTSVRQLDISDAGINDFDFRRTTKKSAFKVVSGEFRTRHLVWRSIVAFLARNVTIGSLATRLNVMSVLLGAITVALAFALCRGLILFINFHDSPVSAEGRKKSAFAAGIVVATSLGFSTPFWLASTRAAPPALDGFLLISMAYLAFTSVITQKTRDLFLLGILWGISLFETDTGIFTGILMLFFAIRAMLVGAMMTVRSWCNLLVGMILGMLAYIIASAFLFGFGGTSALMPIRDLVSSVGIGFSLVRGGIFGNQGLLVSVFFVVLPFAAACALAMWRDAERNAAAAGFLVFLLACTTALSLAKTPISPWGIYCRDSNSFLPITIFVLATATAGYLSSFGAILAKGQLIPPPRNRRFAKQSRRDDDFNEDSVGRIIYWFTLLLAIVCACFNWREIRDNRDRIIETASREILSRMGDKTWITSTTPALDTMLRIGAWEQRRPFHVIPHKVNDSEIKRLSYAISRDEAFRNLDKSLLRDSLSSTNLDAFVSTWISSDPAVGKHLIVDDPQLWIDNGRIPIPAAIGYRALEQGETPDWNAIASDHAALWKAISSADDVLGSAAPDRLRAARGGVRAYLCSIGEHLAAELGKVKDFPATRTRQLLEQVEDLRIEHQPESRNEIFY